MGTRLPAVDATGSDFSQRGADVRNEGRAMTEAEWLEYDHPDDALRRLPQRPSARKFLLFCAACSARMVMVSFYKEAMQSRIREFVAAVERYADDLEEWETVSRSGHSVGTEWALVDWWGRVDGEWVYQRANAGLCACVAAEAGSSDSILLHQGEVTEEMREAWREMSRIAGRTERGDQMRLLRDILGNPFRSVVLDPVWQSRTVVSLAQAAYQDRLLSSGHLDADRLAVLADALEDAGCAEQAVLDHLRGPGPHVRGCWPVDLVLARE
jgi:hypothetical protein